MKSLSIGADRAPLVWILVGLLFNTTGLFLGFEFFQIFGYLAIGGFCIVFGVVLGLLRLRERPRVSEDKRLSPNFVSAGATRIMKVMSASEHAVFKDKTDSAPA